MEKNYFIRLGAREKAGVGESGFIESGSDLVAPNTRKRIFKIVLGAHLALLLALCAGLLVARIMRKPRPSTMRVTLLSAPTSSTSRQPRVSTRPPTPRPEPRKTIARPKPKPKPKTRPKPRPVSKPKPKPKKTSKRKWKPRKSITVSRKVVRKTTTAKPITRPTPPPPRRISATEIEKTLRAERVGTTPTPRSASNAPPSNYYDRVSGVLHSIWRQPSKAELAGTFPTVDLTITVDASGRVSAARVSRRSGNAAMDASAAKLARDLRVLPPPPSGKLTFTVTLEVVE